MADTSSFDIVSELDLQEIDNAVNQATKEVATRYDFRGTSAGLAFDRKAATLTFTADDEAQLKAVRTVVVEKLIKRKVDPKVLDEQKPEQATGQTLRQLVKLRSGIDKEAAKAIVKHIKASKLKVQASIQGDVVRVSGAKRDDLQAVIADLKKNPPAEDVPLQFTNYR